MELRASSVQIQRAKPKLAEPGRRLRKSSRAAHVDAYNSTEPPTTNSFCPVAAMSGTKATAVAGVKRKRAPGKPDARAIKSKPRQKPSSDQDDDPQDEIARLEMQILESRKHYNNIATLLKLARASGADHEASTLAAVALCRVFRL